VFCTRIEEDPIQLKTPSVIVLSLINSIKRKKMMMLTKVPTTFLRNGRSFSAAAGGKFHQSNASPSNRYKIPYCLIISFPVCY
jgi:hypothetical protein